MNVLARVKPVLQLRVSPFDRRRCRVAKVSHFVCPSSYTQLFIVLQPLLYYILPHNEPAWLLLPSLFDKLATLDIGLLVRCVKNAIYCLNELKGRVSKLSVIDANMPLCVSFNGLADMLATEHVIDTVKHHLKSVNKSSLSVVKDHP